MISQLRGNIKGIFNYSIHQELNWNQSFMQRKEAPISINMQRRWNTDHPSQIYVTRQIRQWSAFFFIFVCLSLYLNYLPIFLYSIDLNHKHLWHWIKDFLITDTVFFLWNFYHMHLDDWNLYKSDPHKILLLFAVVVPVVKMCY